MLGEKLPLRRACDECHSAKVKCRNGIPNCIVDNQNEVEDGSPRIGRAKVDCTRCKTHHLQCRFSLEQPRIRGKKRKRAQSATEVRESEDRSLKSSGKESASALDTSFLAEADPNWNGTQISWSLLDAELDTDALLESISADMNVHAELLPTDTSSLPPTVESRPILDQFVQPRHTQPDSSHLDDQHSRLRLINSGHIDTSALEVTPQLLDASSHLSDVLWEFSNLANIEEAALLSRVAQDTIRSFERTFEALGPVFAPLEKENESHAKPTQLHPIANPNIYFLAFSVMFQLMNVTQFFWRTVTRFFLDMSCTRPDTSSSTHSTDVSKSHLSPSVAGIVNMLSPVSEKVRRDSSTTKYSPTFSYSVLMNASTRTHVQLAALMIIAHLEYLHGFAIQVVRIARLRHGEPPINFSIHPSRDNPINQHEQSEGMDPLNNEDIPPHNSQCALQRHGCRMRAICKSLIDKTSKAADLYG